VLGKDGEIIWTDHVRNEEVLRRVKEERNIVHAIKEGRLNGFVALCVGTVLYNRLLKERQRERQK
jgi:hypothetical protein